MVNIKEKKLFSKIVFAQSFFAFILFFAPYSISREIIGVSLFFLFIFILTAYFFLDIVYLKDKRIVIYRLLRLLKVKLIINYSDIVSVKINLVRASLHQSLLIKFLDKERKERNYYLLVNTRQKELEMIIQFL